MKKLKTFLFIIILILTQRPVFASGLGADSLVNKSTIKKGRLALVAGTQSAIFLGGISYLNYVWYRDRPNMPFHFHNDTKGYKQMDKFAHAFVAYYESKLSYQSLRWAGLTKKQALWIGGPMGLLLQTPIEIFDGMHDGYGFSMNDMIANFSGSALFTAQQAIFDEQKLKYKFSFYPSEYPKYHPRMLGENVLENIIQDYNAHTYWLTLSINEIHKTRLPDWLAISVGYSANGLIGEFKNPASFDGTPIPPLERYRQYFFSFDIDCTKIKTKHVMLKKVLNAVNVLKVPMPALEYNRVQGFRAHAVYW